MVYDPMNAIEAFGAGRAYRTRQDVGNALAAGNDRQAEQAAFRGGDTGTGMALRQARVEAIRQARAARSQMDEQQQAAAAQNAQRLGGLATGILSSVPEQQIDAYTRELIQTQGLQVQLPDRPLTRADLEVFATMAEATAGELTAARDRNQVTLGQNEALLRRQGGQDTQTLNQQGTRIQTEAERSNRVGEGINQFQARTGRMNAETGRMGETRQQAAADREAAATQGGNSTFSFGAEGRARVAINLPALELANEQLQQLEEAGVRFNSGIGGNTLATALDSLPFGIGDSAARTVGGDDFSALQRASSAFEAAMLPIMSGAAVTESEARRLIRATLPRPGDSDAVLRAKRAQRVSMVAMARAGIQGSPVNIDQMVAEMRVLAGDQPGLPDDETSSPPSPGNQPANQAAGPRLRFNPQTGELE